MSAQHTPSVSGSDAGAGGVGAHSEYTPRGGNAWFPDIPRILPHEMVFPIQIGSELFRLSGASISSDAPSYFSQFFERQLALTKDERPHIRTLYIDRDPETFRDIARHLQGYHIAPRDGAHFVRLFADAQFYSLPKLISQLFESEIYISIGGRHFQLPRDLFQSPGNSPNYFTLGFAVFFSNPAEVFPGLNREGLLRPPSILPPEVPNRSAEVFVEILNLLRGYPIHIRNEEHRQQLLRDCKYYHFKGLEQRLIPHSISWNMVRGKAEIQIRLEDIKPSGVSFVPDNPTPPVEYGGPRGPAGTPLSTGWINYARPYVDEQPRELVLEISNEATRLDYHSSRVEFSGLTKQRVSALLGVISSKLGLPVSQEWPMGLRMMESINGSGQAGSVNSSPGNHPLSNDRVRIEFSEESDVMLDGESVRDLQGILGRGRDGEGNEEGKDAWKANSTPSVSDGGVLAANPQRKRLKRKHDELNGSSEWIVKRGQWRLRVQPSPSSISASHSVGGSDAAGGPPQPKTPSGLEIVLVAVKLDAFSGQHARNQRRSFLT